MLLEVGSQLSAEVTAQVCAEVPTAIASDINRDTEYEAQLEIRAATLSACWMIGEKRGRGLDAFETTSRMVWCFSRNVISILIRSI